MANAAKYAEEWNGGELIRFYDDMEVEELIYGCSSKNNNWLTWIRSDWMGYSFVFLWWHLDCGLPGDEQKHEELEMSIQRTRVINGVSVACRPGAATGLGIIFQLEMFYLSERFDQLVINYPSQSRDSEWDWDCGWYRFGLFQVLPGGIPR